MINENKVKLMTKIQLFEDKENEALRTNKWFLSDYLGLYLIRSLIAYIGLVAIVCLVVLIFQWEKILTGMQLTDLIEIAKMMLYSFILLLIPSMIISYITYWFRYRKSRKKIREHLNDLRALKSFYEQEEE